MAFAQSDAKFELQRSNDSCQRAGSLESQLDGKRCGDRDRGRRGVTGAAPLAGLAGIRTEYNSTALLNAYTWRNDAIRIKNHSYGYTTPYVNNSAAAAVIAETATHATHPVIHVWAAGNERGELKADANTDSLTASPHVITVAALGSKGKYASYSCFGASVIVTAPSSTSSSEGFDGTTTTDLVGTGGYNDGLGGSDYSNNRYTNYFGGTSSAAPLVSGVLALAVQARTEAGFTSDVRRRRDQSNLPTLAG